MRLTDEQIKAATSVDLVDYCNAVGIPIVLSSGDTYQHAEYDSLKITGNKWIRFSGRSNGVKGYTKGNPIHFVQEYEGLSFQAAVLKLLEVSRSPLLPEGYKTSVKMKLKSYDKKSVGAKPFAPVQRRPMPETVAKPAKAKKEFALPTKNADNRHVFAYLTKTRGIDEEIVKHMIKNGSLYEDIRHNCVFVGFDKDNAPRYAALKGTYTQGDKPMFKGEVEGSKKRFSWCFTPDTESPLLRVYESPIDAISHMSIEKGAGANWFNKHYLSLGSLAYEALPEYLKNHPEIKTISFCLDNDIAGRQKTEEFTVKLVRQGYSCTNWHKTDTLVVCRFNWEPLEKYLATNPQIRNISFEIGKTVDREAANVIMQKLKEKGYNCIEESKEPMSAKDYNKMLQLRNMNEEKVN
jgi:hypothetical protein